MGFISVPLLWMPLCTLEHKLYSIANSKFLYSQSLPEGYLASLKFERRNGINAATTRSNLLSMETESLPTHSRGIYFGGWEQPIYEKSVKFQMPSKSQVLVKVHSIGLNPVDAKQVIGDKLKYSWTSVRRWSHEYIVKDTRVGFDFSGIVAQDDHPMFPKGTRVFGAMPPLQGSCADYICAPHDQIAKAPDTLSLEECAALPLVGLTAWQALSPYIVRDQSNVLIIGGSGGTGHVALQVAKALGAKDVVTICSTSNIEFVKDCGATHVVDYKQSENIVEDLRLYGPFHVILDCVTSADPEDARFDYPRLLRTSPGLTSTNHIYQRLGGQSSDWIRAGLARPNKLPHSWLWKDPRERLFWIRFPASSHELEELASLADSGQLRPRIQDLKFGLTTETIQQAFDQILSRRMQGKLVVKVDAK